MIQIPNNNITSEDELNINNYKFVASTNVVVKILENVSKTD